MESVRRLSVFRILLGLGLLAAGVLLVLDQAGWIESADLLERWWPAALIVLGIVHLISARRLDPGALIVALAGVVLLLVTLDLISGDATALLFPLALVLAGLWVLLGRSVHRRHESEDTVRSFSAFGGADVVQDSPQFAGGTVIQLFGGTTLDLRQARPAPEGASIDALAAFGGVDIIIPRGWRVTMSGIPLFGAYSTPVDESVAPMPVDEFAPLLSINALVAFGGIEVKYDRS